MGEGIEATFFVTARDRAIGVAAAEDLPCDPAGDPLRLGSSAVLRALAHALCGQTAPRIQALRDATCRSFPVFEFPKEVSAALAALQPGDLDRVAERWLEDPSWSEADVDLFEVASLLSEVRESLMASEEVGSSLFVLLEQKAF